MRTFLILAPLLLAGCDAHRNDATKNGDDVHVSVAQDGDGDGGGGHVSLNIPGFDGKFSIPAFFMKNGHMDIDGLKLAPETAIRSVDIVGKDKDGAKEGDGTVHLTFANPKRPTDLVAYYRQAAEGAGYTVSQSGGDGLVAIKGRKTVAISLHGEGDGSRGAIDVNEKG